MSSNQNAIIATPYIPNQPFVELNKLVPFERMAMFNETEESKKNGDENEREFKKLLLAFIADQDPIKQENVLQKLREKQYKECFERFIKEIQKERAKLYDRQIQCVASGLVQGFGAVGGIASGIVNIMGPAFRLAPGICLLVVGVLAAGLAIYFAVDYYQTGKKIEALDKNLREIEAVEAKVVDDRGNTVSKPTPVNTKAFQTSDSWCKFSWGENNSTSRSNPESMVLQKERTMSL